MVKIGWGWGKSIENRKNTSKRSVNLQGAIKIESAKAYNFELKINCCVLMALEQLVAVTIGKNQIFECI